jgi:hypothetical protein
MAKSFGASGDGAEAGPPWLFVHDFVAIDLPLDTVIAQFGRRCTADVVAAIVLDAWHHEAEAAQHTTSAHPIRTVVPTVDVELGPPRIRSDSVVVPVRWRTAGDDWIPGVEADLELAPFGPQRSHLHLLGRYELPVDVERWSAEASVLNRLAVALVRRTLDRLREHLAEQLHERSDGGDATGEHDR